MEGRFNGGFFALPVWGAYIWRGLFSEFYGSSKNDNLKQGETKILELAHVRSSREVTDKIIIKKKPQQLRFYQPLGSDDRIKWWSRLQ